MGLKQYGSVSPLYCGHYNDSMWKKGDGSGLEGVAFAFTTFFQLVSGF